MTIRSLVVEDIPDVDRLTRTAGWNQIARDWRRLLRFEPAGCFAAVFDRRVVGCATIVGYGVDLAWIGMVIVHPSARRKGVGKALVDSCLGFARGNGIATVGLDATYMGRPLYEVLGFRRYRGILRMRGVPLGRRDSHARPLDRRDLDALFTLDRESFGLGRSRVIQALVEDYPNLSYVVERNGRIEAAVLGRRGHSACQIGPLLAHDDGDLTALLDAIFSELNGSACMIDLSESDLALRTRLVSWGFKEDRVTQRMTFGKPRLHENWRSYRAIHCPELG